MIEIKMFSSRDGPYGFQCLGHANYAERGKDIVCAAVSALVINTVNSIRTLSNDYVTLENDDMTGLIFCTVHEPSKETVLLLRSLEIGLRSLQAEYSKYIQMQ